MKRTFKRYLVTAALPYANGKIHLGHLAGAYLPSDIYVRFQRSMKRDVLFICGSDEHGVAITISAEQEKTTPQAVVDKYHALNKAAFAQFGMSFDNYSRTSLPLHHETAREFFVKLHAAGILKEKKQEQLYDEKANMFLPDRYVEGTCPKCAYPDARGDQCERCGTYLDPTELINPRSKITGDTPTVLVGFSRGSGLAVVAEVGYYDMLRYETKPNGAFNHTEYGSVADPTPLGNVASSNSALPRLRKSVWASSSWLVTNRSSLPSLS